MFLKNKFNKKNELILWRDDVSIKIKLIFVEMCQISYIRVHDIASLVYSWPFISSETSYCLLNSSHMSICSFISTNMLFIYLANWKIYLSLTSRGSIMFYGSPYTSNIILGLQTIGDYRSWHLCHPLSTSI